MSNKGEGQVTESNVQGEQPATESATEKVSEEVAAKEKEHIDAETLQQEIEKQKELAKHHLEQWKRTAADLENYRKRVEKEREELVKFGHAALITTLLPILDDFERAFQTLPVGLNSLTWIEGLALIDRKLRVALEQQGLKEIEALGKPFDPARHEAVLQEETSAYPDGQVMAVLQKGYMLHDRVLRPAMVKVAKNTNSHQTAEAAKGNHVKDETEEKSETK